MEDVFAVVHEKLGKAELPALRALVEQAWKLPPRSVVFVEARFLHAAQAMCGRVPRMKLRKDGSVQFGGASGTRWRALVSKPQKA